MMRLLGVRTVRGQIVGRRADTGGFRSQRLLSKKIVDQGVILKERQDGQGSGLILRTRLGSGKTYIAMVGWFLVGMPSIVPIASHAAVVAFRLFRLIVMVGILLRHAAGDQGGQQG